MPANDTVCGDLPLQDNATFVKITPDLMYLNVGEKVAFRESIQCWGHLTPSAELDCVLVNRTGGTKTSF